MTISGRSQPIVAVFVLAVLVSGCTDARDDERAPGSGATGRPLASYEGCWGDFDGCEADERLPVLDNANRDSPFWVCQDRLVEQDFTLSLWSNPVSEQVGVSFESVPDKMAIAFVKVEEGTSVRFVGWSIAAEGLFTTLGVDGNSARIQAGTIVANTDTDSPRLARISNVVPQSTGGNDIQRILYSFVSGNATYVFPGFPGIEVIHEGSDFSMSLVVRATTVGGDVFLTGSSSGCN